MAEAVGDVCYEVEVGSLGTAEEAVYGLDDGLDDVYVLPLVEASYIVCLGYGAVVEDGVYCPCVVNDIEPVSYVLALAVDGERLAVAYVVDEEGNELLWELVGSVVVAAVGDNGGHAVCVVEGAYEMVTGCLAC